MDVVTHLADALVLERRVGHCAPFGDAVAERFLDEYVFAGLEGVNRRDRVPVVRSDDYDRVDFFQIEQAAVVTEVLRLWPARFFNCGRGAVEMAPVHVADGRDPNVLLLQELLQPSRTHAAHADHSQNDLVVRALRG